MTTGHGRPYLLVHQKTGEERLVVATSGPQALRFVATDWSCAAASAIDTGLHIQRGGSLEFATEQLARVNAFDLAQIEQPAQDAES